MPTTMSPARARGTRRSQLEADLAVGARCPSSDEDFFREDGESTASWVIRREGLRSECAGCPVLAQCRELALRYDADVYDAASGKNDCMVRGGLTAKQIAETRRSTRHARSLAKAVLADRRAGRKAAADDQERARINQLLQVLRRSATAHPDPRKKATKIHAENAAKAVVELRVLRTARRQRNGWTKEAVAA